jgi:hypothetical protein
MNGGPTPRYPPIAGVEEQPHFRREARERIGRLYDTDIKAHVPEGSVREDI